jgi:uncharacterized membrane protein
MNAVNLWTALAVGLMGLLLCVTPALTQPTLQFGVRVPPDRLRAPVITNQRRRYFWRTATATAGLTAAALFVPTDLGWLVGVLVAAQLAVSLACYFVAREHILAVKASEDWFGGLRQIVGTDTTWRTQPERFPVVWLVPALTIVAVTAIVGVVRYPHLPNPLPVHLNAAGVADRYADKSVWTAFSALAVQLFVTVIMSGLLALTYRSRPEIDVTDVAGSARRYRRFLFAVSRAMLVCAALVDLSMMLVAFQIWQVFRVSSGTMTILVTAPSVLGVIVLVSVIMRTGQAGSRLAGATASGGATDHNLPTNRDDDRYWKGGLIYVNRDDPALLVPRRYGVGWTLNFGNPRSWVVSAVFIAVVVGLLLVLPHHRR